VVHDGQGQLARPTREGCFASLRELAGSRELVRMFPRVDFQRCESWAGSRELFRKFPRVDFRRCGNLLTNCVRERSSSPGDQTHLRKADIRILYGSGRSHLFEYVWTRHIRGLPHWRETCTSRVVKLEKRIKTQPCVRQQQESSISRRCRAV
jgi:hypothetical protein